jgi:hypothetical protein
MNIGNIVLQHPKLHLVTDRVKGAINLAMEKVVAHHDNPQQYPLPSDPKALERALHNLYSKLSNHKQKKMADKARINMKKTAAQRTQIYGDLMAVNLKSSVSIVQQVKTIPPPANFKFTASEITALKRKIGFGRPPVAKAKTSAARAKGRTPAPPAAIALASDLSFFIDSLTCIKKSEIGKDEINLAGIGFDSAGVGTELPPFFVGKFKKGDTIAVGKNPFNFKLDQAVFPQTFSAGLFIIEEDLLRNSDALDALMIVLVAVGGALFTISTAMCIVGLAGGPFSVALIVALFVGGVVATAIGLYVLPLLADDFSAISFDLLTFDAPVEPGKQFDRTIAIEGAILGVNDIFNGKYQAAAHWLTK